MYKNRGTGYNTKKENGKVKDGMQIDIIINASLPEEREIPSAMGRILDRICAFQ